MDEIISQQKIKEDLDAFDIDLYLLKKKEALDKKIREHLIKVEAFKLTRSKNNGR
jgi:hypothetical protein